MEKEPMLKLDGIKASDYAKLKAITTDAWIKQMEQKHDKVVIYSAGYPDSILYVTGPGWLDNRRY